MSAAGCVNSHYKQAASSIVAITAICVFRLQRCIHAGLVWCFTYESLLKLVNAKLFKEDFTPWERKKEQVLEAAGVAFSRNAIKSQSVSPCPPGPGARLEGLVVQRLSLSLPVESRVI